MTDLKEFRVLKNSKEKEMKKEIVMRMICKAPYGKIGINGQEDIAWEFIDKATTYNQQMQHVPERNYTIDKRMYVHK